MPEIMPCSDRLVWQFVAGLVAGAVIALNVRAAVVALLRRPE